MGPSSRFCGGFRLPAAAPTVYSVPAAQEMNT
jgi:hypothetical protein